MDADELEQALRARILDFARWLFPDGQLEGKAWKTHSGSIYVQGLRAGTWSGGGTLLDLYSDIHAVSKKAAVAKCADWIAAPFVQPIPVPVNEEVQRLAAIDEEVNALPRNVLPMRPPWQEAAPAKLLPSSEDAERGVLGSVLIAPEPVLELCSARGVMPEWFHIPAHRILFGFIVALRASRQPIDVITLSQVLRDHGQLDAVGGPAFVTQLFTFLPSGANAAYYIQIVKEKFTLREIIRVGSESVRKAYDEQGDVELLVKETRSGIEQIAEKGSTVSIREQLAKQAFDKANPPVQPVPLFSIGESILATAGNLMAIQAKAKAGKTALLGAMIASTMEPVNDVFGLVSANPLKHALVHFDTEQSPWDHHVGILRALQRAGKEEAPTWLRSYRVTETPLQMRLEMIRFELKRAKAECGGILALIIDGIGDLCLDVNDAAESNLLVGELHALAIEFNTVIVCVLHENPGSETAKTRGHLGSQLERKAETNLRLEKDADGVTVIFTERARNTHIPKERGAKFSWNDEAKMHLSTTAEFNSKPKNRGQFPGKFSEETILSKLSLIDGVHPAKLKKDLKEFHGMSDRTFYRYIAELNKAGRIDQRDDMWFLKSKPRE